MQVFGLVGWSGSGKTTLLARLIPELTGRGLVVSTMKHTHHKMDIDQPGKDSFTHRQAGAHEVLLASSKRYAIMREIRDEPEPTVDDLLRRMAPVDLVLIEGFREHRYPKLEVYRAEKGRPLRSADDPTLVAIATDGPIDEAPVPLLDLNNPAEIAAFILRHCKLESAAE